MSKPTVFIGSSSEGLEFARAARRSLSDSAEITLWNEGFFELGDTFIESLVNKFDNFDFAVLVLTPDDLNVKGGKKRLLPRDNVIFELGLFMGRLGRERTFLLHQKDTRLPDDLSGVTTALYEWPRNDSSYDSAVGGACDRMRSTICNLGLSSVRAQQKINDVVDEQKEQKSIIEKHQEYFDIVKYSLSAFCYASLWQLDNSKTYMYRHGDSFQRRMYFLANSGYIKPKENIDSSLLTRETDGSLVFGPEMDGMNLCNIVELTPIGKYLLSLRGEPNLY